MNMNMNVLSVCLVFASLLLASASAQSWQPERAPLMTPWAEEVSPENVLSEYPRPQLEREEWLNLNGLWEYALRPQDEVQPETFDGDILVPFPVESALSGVMERVDGRRLWYRRGFTVPKSWADERVLLQFGAVDWETTVWVNGTEVGTHRGGYDPFSFDITDALTEAGEQEIVVGVLDPTDAGTQPRGKQVNNPEGIWYTPSTGIWQTVWLEPVPETHITDLKMTPDIEAGVLELEAQGSRAGNVVATVLDGDEVIAEMRGVVGEKLRLAIPDAKLWSPDAPFLYDVDLRMEGVGGAVDKATSYFGMRDISVGPDKNGVTRLLLNGEPLFQYGLLDQGYWPDGLYTAPTDEALRHDLEMTKTLGFNMVRKHVKVEPARWYYWADKLGLLVWQDMPSGDAFAAESASEITRSPESAEQFELELKRMVDTHRNHPSVVMWVLFNEGWGQYDTERLADWLERYDPSRLVNSASGWNDVGAGNVYDIHSYPGPSVPPPSPVRAQVLGEFGGLGLTLPGVTWQGEANWGYQQFSDQAALTAAYGDLVTNLRNLSVERGLSAAVYTQTTDVESEVNGALSYDRRLIKLESAVANRRLYEPLPTTETLSPTSEYEGVAWRYTFEEPAGAWAGAAFDDSGWPQAPGGFGEPESRGNVARTEWTGPDIWMRRTFNLDGVPNNPFLRLHHEEDVEIFLNGQKLLQFPFYTQTYINVPLDTAAFETGRNVLAVHCKRIGPGPHCDVGLYDGLEPPDKVADAGSTASESTTSDGTASEGTASDSTASEGTPLEDKPLEGMPSEVR